MGIWAGKQERIQACTINQHLLDIVQTLKIKQVRKRSFSRPNEKACILGTPY